MYKASLLNPYEILTSVIIKSGPTPIEKGPSLYMEYLRFVLRFRGSSLSLPVLCTFTVELKVA